MEAWLHLPHRRAVTEKSEAIKRTRGTHGAICKDQVALAAVNGNKTVAELAEQFQIHLTQITDWKQRLPARSANTFGGSHPSSDTLDLKTLPLLHEKIGQLTLKNECLEVLSIAREAR